MREIAGTPVRVYAKRYRAVWHYSAVLPELVCSTAGFRQAQPCHALAARGVVVICDLNHWELAERLLAGLTSGADLPQPDTYAGRGTTGAADCEERS